MKAGDDVDRRGQVADQPGLRPPSATTTPADCRAGARKEDAVGEEAAECGGVRLVLPRGPRHPRQTASAGVTRTPRVPGRHRPVGVRVGRLTVVRVLANDEGGPPVDGGPPRFSAVVGGKERYPLVTVNGPATPSPEEVTQILPGLVVPAAALRSRMS